MRDIGKTTKQSERWSCGPAAIVNAVTTLGLVIDEKEVIGFATSDGMNEVKVMDALTSLGLEPRELTMRDADQAWKTLTSNIPAILIVDRDSHWVAATLLVADGSVEIRDPASGTKVYDQEQLATRWLYEGRYYMITMGAVR